MACTARPVSIPAPASRAAAAKRCVTVPMPPLTIIQVPSLPGSRHMLWMRKFIPVPGVSQSPLRPEKPSVTAYIALRRSLRKAKRSRYSPTGLRHRSTNTRRSAGRTYFSALSSIESGSSSQVGATSSRIWAISACSASFARQSWALKKARNCSFIAAVSEPKSRYRLPVVGRK